MNIRRILCGVLVACMLLQVVATPAFGTGIEEAQQKQQELTSELNALNQQLISLSSEINDLEQEMLASETLVRQLNEEILLLEEEKQRQYESMKLRIQYTYENSDSGLLESLLESKSLAEFVNRAEYFAVVMEYDRRMMDNYEELITTIETNKATVVAEKERQQQLMEGVAQKQNQIVLAIANTQQSLISVGDEIDAYIAEIEANEKVEDVGTPDTDIPANEGGSNNTEEDAGNTSTGNEDLGDDSDSGNMESSDSDLMLLAALIECEAGGEPYEGKLAVGSVVINRVNSSRFPNTIVGVIYQNNQFSPVASGKLAAVLARGAKQSCIDAAREVLNGNITLDCLFFRVNDGREGIVIGNHVFY